MEYLEHMEDVIPLGWHVFVWTPTVGVSAGAFLIEDILYNIDILSYLLVSEIHVIV
jgi:hypothetical protein